MNFQILPTARIAFFLVVLVILQAIATSIYVPVTKLHGLHLKAWDLFTVAYFLSP